MEIVTSPGLSNADDACDFVNELHLMLVTLGTCKGKMSGMLHVLNVSYLYWHGGILTVVITQVFRFIHLVHAYELPCMLLYG